MHQYFAKFKFNDQEINVTFYSGDHSEEPHNFFVDTETVPRFAGRFRKEKAGWQSVYTVPNESVGLRRYHNSTRVDEIRTMPNELNQQTIDQLNEKYPSQ